jgi:pimeloyl-ACP methyl ester carboxylesterase
MSRVAQYYRTGKDALPNGLTETLPPHEYGPLVLEYQHLEDFAPAADLDILRAMLRAHLYEDGPAERAAFAAMSTVQVAEAKLLLDANSHTTLGLLEQTERRHAAEMTTVSPHDHLASLTTPIYLLHGEGDNIIPSAETEWMATELPRKTLQSALISPVLSHLNLDGQGPSTLDNLRLVHFFALILRDAEAR